MKLVYPAIDCIFHIEESFFNQLIIENQSLFRKFVEDLYSQTAAYDGEIVLSDNEKPIPISKHVDLITQFIPFEINRKDLITKITATLEKQSVHSDFYERGVRLMADIERFISDVSFEIPGDIEVTKISISTLLKAAGIRIRDDYDNLLEKILDYMELVVEYIGPHLFFFVNMRSYFCDSALEQFTTSALQHGYRFFLLDNHAGNKLENERRITVDADLCVF